MESDGARVQCHICGEWFAGLGIHAWQKHDVTVDEYRAYFGLNYTAPLAGLAYRDKLRTPKQREHLARLREQIRTTLSEQGVEYAWELATPEQQLEAKQRKRRQQGRIANTEHSRKIGAKQMHTPEAWQRISDKKKGQTPSDAAKKAYERRHNRIELPCAVCGTPVSRKASLMKTKHGVTCSDKCYRELHSRITATQAKKNRDR